MKKAELVVTVEVGKNECVGCNKYFIFTIKTDNANRCFDCWMKKEVEARVDDNKTDYYGGA